MSLIIVKWERAISDLGEHYANILSDKVQPADEFLIVAEKSFERLAQFPDVGLPWTSDRRYLRGIRHYPMPSPYRSYIVFYRVAGDVLEVIAVLHGARDLERTLREIVE